MKLGAAHRDPNAARSRPPKDFPAPPGYRLIERVDGLSPSAEPGRPHAAGPFAAWTADGPGGSRVVLSAYRGDSRHAQSDGQRAVHSLRAARHPNLLAITGAWGGNGTLVIATEPAPRSLLDLYEDAKAAGARGVDRDTLTEALADAAKALDYLNHLYPDCGHGAVTPDAFRLVGGGIKLALPDPWSWVPAEGAGRRSDQASLAAVYASLRGGGPAESSADLSALPAEERPAVARALADDPEVRWPSCRAFIDGLRADVLAAEAVASLSAPFRGEGAEALGLGTGPRTAVAPRAVVGRARAFALAAATGLTAAAVTFGAVRFAADAAAPAPRTLPVPDSPARLAGFEPADFRHRDEAVAVAVASETPAPPPRRRAEAVAEPPPPEAEPTGAASDTDGGEGEAPADAPPRDDAAALVAAAAHPASSAPDADPEAEAGPESARPALNVTSPVAFKVVGGMSSALPVGLASSGVTPPEFDVRLTVEDLPKGVRAEARSVRLAAATGARVDVTFTAAEDAEADATVRLVAVSRGAGERVETVTPVRLAVRPRPGLLARRRGDEALRREAYDLAVRAYDEALGEAPGDLAALHGRGLANYGKGDLDRALVDLGEAARRGPDDASVRNNLGLARLARGDAAGARSDFEAALKLDPEFAVVHYNLGRSFAETGDPSRAVTEYDETVRLNPTFAKAFKARADALARLGDRARALADYDEAVRLNPDDAASLNNRGLLRLARGEPQHAISDFDEASRLNPSFAVVHYNRGRVYAQLGDTTEAITSFDRALKLDPKFVRAYKARAEAYTRRGDLTRAGSDRDEAARLEGPPAPASEVSAVPSAPTAFFGKPTAGR